MKLRQGFVSNSSSSSFIMGVPKGSTEQKIREILKKNLDIKNCSIFPNLEEEVLDTIIWDMEAIKDIDEYIKERDWEKLDYLKEMSLKMDIYTGDFPNDNTAMEGLLCDAEIDINEDDLYFKEAGY